MGQNGHHRAQTMDQCTKIDIKNRMRKIKIDYRNKQIQEEFIKQVESEGEDGEVSSR